MKSNSVLALAFAVSCTVAVAADNPLDALKGKMKEGMYDYKMEMDMSGVPGMPKGMGTQTHNFQKCVTAQDIEKGQMGRGGATGKAMDACEVSNFKMSGNTASYTMVCKQPAMSADNNITFGNDGFQMDMKVAMTQQGGQVMNMKQHMEGKYLGPCK